MNSVEEFNNYYLTQISDIGNKENFEEQKGENIDFDKEKEYNIIIDINNSDNKKEIRKKESIAKRLKSYPKNYQTYKLEYKKYIIEIVNKLLILFLQVKKNNNDEEKVAKSYGIKLKTLRRWLTKGFKEYTGKYINKYYFNIKEEEEKLGNLRWKKNY